MQILYALEKCGILITKFTRYTSKIVRNSLLVLYAENREVFMLGSIKKGKKKTHAKCSK